ncbi:hypothetical protein SAMN05216268_1235 [Streptomyces yunnanensis]|uniref:Uncharacterized protein n=1 Tax=Streptomyces yunnanensis TaxID=156453 RepID=A0A9X8N6X6_9ACTN|nr:hypothetical protein SAMN05216268_1235 [Streptomyces yunnanensis]
MLAMRHRRRLRRVLGHDGSSTARFGGEFGKCAVQPRDFSPSRFPGNLEHALPVPVGCIHCTDQLAAPGEVAGRLVEELPATLQNRGLLPYVRHQAEEGKHHIEPISICDELLARVPQLPKQLILALARQGQRMPPPYAPL